MVRKLVKKLSACVLAAAVVAGLTGCGSVTSGKRIVRISHAQSETHPEHLGLLAFKKYVEERLGDKYEVQIFQMSFWVPHRSNRADSDRCNRLRSSRYCKPGDFRKRL